LRQRNALLRQNAAADDFAPWEHDLGRVALEIHALRTACLERLEPYVAQEAALLIPELGNIRIDYRPGWDVERGLAWQLSKTGGRDREAGFTRVGAHRADWVIGFGGAARREHLSRGQAKAAALVCTLALARWLSDSIGEYPLLCLDDLDSELDSHHTERVLRWLRETPIQSWLTVTHQPDRSSSDAKLFHVKHSGCTSGEARA
jgi:DNA replication and repair protein RecF